jgi:hypothetical protein
MSKLEVDAVEPQSGTSLTLGASGDTITFPAGSIISNQGTATGFGPTGAVSWDVANIKTTGFTAVNGLGYFCNTTSSAFTVTLPASPSAGNVVAISDYAATFATNNITVNPNGNKIAGSTLNKLLNTNGIAVTIVYVDSTEGWIVTDSGLQSNFNSIPYSVDFLVIAGGGGGGFAPDGFSGGGGGAGGYRNSYSTENSGGGGSSEASLTFNLGTVYTITVGAGGAVGASGGATSGGVGSNSSISGTGITTITSSGGGGGGDGFFPNSGGYNGASGGSGGGGGCGQGNPGSGGVGGSGTANQGYGGGTARSHNNADINLQAGGGGGASAVGGLGGATVAGAGGAGLASSITGSSVTRGGGGGGGTYNQSYGPGGTGGGGTGGTQNDGTANTGGGGAGNVGAGGSGVVILRMPTANYSGTTTGSPTVTTSGSDTILVFNSSGTITG